MHVYGIFTYLWVIFRENVGKYSILGAQGIDIWRKNMENYGKHMEQSTRLKHAKPATNSANHQKCCLKQQQRQGFF
jgi:hypothetical protein